jgi:hypothetical protein
LIDAWIDGCSKKAPAGLFLLASPFREAAAPDGRLRIVSRIAKMGDDD